jgi:hypothetical protein
VIRENADRPWSERGTTDDSLSTLTQGMSGYLRAVAEAVGVPPEGATFEISDTVTAYLALTRRWPARPGRDLMAIWSEVDGWTVSVETDPSEPAVVLARWRDTDLVPEPGAVARFVTDAVTSENVERTVPSVLRAPNRGRLAERLTRYVVPM